MAFRSSVLLLSSLGVANAALQFDFTKQRRSIPASEASKHTRRDNVNVELDNVDQILYLMEATVGTPPQKLTLQVDTGSSDMWVPLTKSQACVRDNLCNDGAFDFEESSSFFDYKVPFRASYGDGTQIFGNYVLENVGVSDVSLTNVTMGVAINVTGNPTGVPYIGIVGLGMKSGEFGQMRTPKLTYPTFTETLKEQGHIDTEAYSMWLDDLKSEDGSILFGAVDKSKYTGDLVSMPIIADPTTGLRRHFTVNLDSVSVTGAKDEEHYAARSQAIPAIIDSGTTLTFLPDAIVDAIDTGIGAIRPVNGQGRFIPCSYGKTDLVFHFGFGSSAKGKTGVEVDVPISEMVLPIIIDGKQATLTDGTEICKWGMRKAGDGPVLLGDTFMRSAYVVFDLENEVIAIAQTNFDGGEADLVDIKGSIPGAKKADAPSSGSGGATTTAATTGTTTGTATITKSASTGTGAATVTTTGTKTGTKTGSTKPTKSGSRSDFDKDNSNNGGDADSAAVKLSLAGALVALSSLSGVFMFLL